MSKPKLKLSIDEQIEHMKTKGILFNIIDDESAKSFLLNHNYYFRIKSYAKNYDRYLSGSNKGKYINLEFAYLQELSTLDMYLRKFILRMTIDIEHFLKTQMLRDFASNQNSDGYEIIDEFFNKSPYVKDNIERLKNSSFCYDLIEKYGDKFAIWNIVEVMSFGDFIKLYEYYYYKYNSPDNMTNFLWSVRFIRNAAAHNNCLLNSLKKPYGRRPIKPNKELNTYISKIDNITKTMRQKKMNNPVVHDFVVTIHLFNKIVSSEKIRHHTMNELKEVIDIRFAKNKEYFSKNEIIKSNYKFIKKIVDFYCVNRI